MNLTKEQLIACIKAELNRQVQEGDDDSASADTEIPRFTILDGHFDLVELAEAIEAADLREYRKIPGTK